MRFRTLLVSLLVVTSVLATSVAAQNFTRVTVKETDAASGIANAVTRLPRTGTVWAGWIVPTTGKSICCWTDGNGCCGRCTLDGRRGGFSITDDTDMPFTAKMLLVARLENGKLQRIRMFSATCPIEGNGETVHMLTNVGAEASLDYLRANLREADKSGEIIAAMSMHDHPRVAPDLIALARSDRESTIRKEAIFWLGQKAGEKAAGELRRAIDEDPDEDVKQHAVFAISQLPRERSVPLLIELVKTHKSREIRKRAMFWLAQTGDPRAVDLIEQILLR